MTVAELMQKLAQYPPDTKVLVTGYEDGYDDITGVHTVSVKSLDGPDYDGAYEDARRVESDEEPQLCVYLPR